MRLFIKRALQKIDELDKEKTRDFIMTASREIGRLETVMDSLLRGVLVCDTAHNLILANKSARRFFSIVSYEQGRETVWSVIPDNRVADFLARTLLSADKAEREFGVDVGGTERLLSVSVMPVVQERQVTGSLILIEDNTERRAREAKLRLMENLASLTTLAAGVAHEIKNPLGSLSIHVQLIQKAMDAQEKLCAAVQDDSSECEPGGYFRLMEKYLKVVNEEVDRLNSIVVDFLFAVRPMNAEFRRGDFNDFLRELAEFVSFELEEAGVKLAMNLADNLPALDFDASLMKQAFLNLIKNAAAAMRGGGTLSVSTEKAENEVKINVADTGAGIPEEDFPKIFEPYFTTKENGTGLGLTVVFKVIKEHRGEINVQSREGEGTVFSITLPVPQVERRLIPYIEEGIQ
jgi:signal transduction histidine kinase